MMMPALLLAMVAGDVQVRSDPACIAPEVLVDGLQPELDVADEVQIAIYPQPSTSEPWLVVLDAALVHTEPLHRTLGLRAVECADVVDVIALWLRLHRVRGPRPASGDGGGDGGDGDGDGDGDEPVGNPGPSVTNTHHQRPRPDRREPPSTPLKALAETISDDDRALQLMVAGGLGWGSLGTTVQIEAGAIIAPGLLLAAGAQLGVEDTHDLGLTIDAGLVSNVGNVGNVGTMTNLSDVTLQLRAGLWAGVAAGEEVEQQVTGACNAPTVIAIAHPTRQLAIGPRVTARVSYHWLYLEGAAVWRLPADTALQATVSAGVQISFSP